MWQFFTERGKQVIQTAQNRALSLGHAFVGTEHLLLGLIEQKDTADSMMLRTSQVSFPALTEKIRELRPQEKVREGVSDLPISQNAREALNAAIRVARELHSGFVGTEHLMLGILSRSECTACRALSLLGADPDMLRDKLTNRLKKQNPSFEKEKGKEREKEPQAASSAEPKGWGSRERDSRTSAVARFCVDLTDKASRGEIDPLIGRENEMRRMMQVLCRRRKNNPVLLGNPGVGKTAIAEGLALKISKGDEDVPSSLRNKRVLELSMGAIVAGTRYRGDFEERMKKLVDELAQSKDTIVFIDELHSIVCAGDQNGNLDAANILKPGLARGDFQIIGATTYDEYAKYIEKDAALERRFMRINVGEPGESETIAILEGLKDSYEKHYSVHYTPDALEAAVKLSTRYISDGNLPDKAIDLIDEAGARVRMNFPDVGADSSLTVNSEDIAEVISQMSGIPVASLTEQDTTKLLHLEDEIHKRLIGQNDAVSALCRAVRRSGSGLKDPSRPVGSFLFLGPSGVGKTELAKGLARSLFGSEKSLLTFDMSEYMSKEDATKLIGAPPGYVGFEDRGRLTDAVRRQPRAVVLFDEVEKAHPDIFNILLQILDEGRLTDAHKRTVDFKNTVIIMTSNLGSTTSAAKRSFGFQSSDAAERQSFSQSLLEEAKRFFRPEFLNRVDAQLVFHPLSADEMDSVLGVMLDDLRARLDERGIAFTIDGDARGSLISETVSQNQGARPLRRLIQTRIEDPMSDMILSGGVSIGMTVNCSLKDGKFAFSLKKPRKPRKGTKELSEETVP